MAQQRRTKQNSGLAGQGVVGTPTQPQRGNVGSQAARIAPTTHNMPQQRRTAQPPQQQAIPRQNAQIPRQPIPNATINQQAYMQPQRGALSQKEQKKAEKANKKHQKQVRKNIEAQNKQKKEAEKAARKNRREKEPLFSRIKFFFQTTNIKEIYNNVLVWVDKNYIFPFLLGAVLIAVGLLFNRYISFGGAFALVLLGVLMSRKDLENGYYCCYGAAIMTFIIPYLF